MSLSLFQAYKKSHTLFGRTRWHVKDKCLFHNLMLTHPLLLHRKGCCCNPKTIWKWIKRRDVKHPKHCEKTNLGAQIAPKMTFHTDPNGALTRTFSVHINHHTGNEEQSLSWENNGREKINKVSSGAIRKPNNEVWRNSLKNWRRQHARPEPAGVEADARNVRCVKKNSPCASVYETPGQSLMNSFLLEAGWYLAIHHSANHCLDFSGHFSP